MENNNNDTSINLNKYISSTGICSRREAERFITEGRVTINGKPTQLGNRVHEGDVVKIDGKPLKAKPKTIHIALNKPKGIVCTTDSKERKNIVKFVGHPQRLFPIGRLDKPSEGLIFLTNDGDIVNKILRAGNNHEKEYIVTVNKPFDERFIKRMSNGIPILGTVTKKCKVERINDTTFKIILVQGLNRQIRRMCEYLGYDVKKLKRTRIMNVTLGSLKVGEWRELSSKEMDEINKLVAGSSKTYEEAEKKNQKASPQNNKQPKKEASFKSKFGRRRKS
ncbi:MULTISPECIES: 23S rRNA pseudouridine(2604) synthase RluF [Tenacibaculum]|uniref:23S rRNA pseudouridine(2604) synthase RluF n=1 Tax=Tenacibaculum TaxID=104267 RepID=UPI0012E52DB1|nr:23S rRNA pseudouridine(2604) synthase RluF [Tenacibaculum sp. XPcli2-G]MCO7185326.1 23S rRNA pseudouridine(2604) synthase RluF [Tenacibaculum sp. XPcli2-G]BFF41421.1 23S rRNA pseudouridine(2604) synthase RluF [Tenacibaculum mesophilum]GFD74504.1 pseudouridine synthase [Tenacibaculum sp. KUL113]GFD79274.1 pseudouridine synthase [Tenacibaculum sp. KUL118]